MKQSTRSRPLPDYDGNETRGAKAQLTDDLSKWIAALVAQGWSFHRIMRHPDPHPNLPKSIEVLLNWWTYGEQQTRRKGDKASVYATFAERLSRALQIQALSGYDQLLDIEHRILSEPRYHDNPAYDKAVALQALKDGREYPEPKYLNNPRYLDVAAANCVLHSIRWRLARLAPEKFGDKLEIYKHITHEHKLQDDAPEWLQAQIGTGPRVIDGTATAAPAQLKIGKAAKES